MVMEKRVIVHPRNRKKPKRQTMIMMILERSLPEMANDVPMIQPMIATVAIFINKNANSKIANAILNLAANVTNNHDVSNIVNVPNAKIAKAIRYPRVRSVINVIIIV